jgi:hypothetical protein
MTIRRSERAADADRAPGRQFEGHFGHPQDIEWRLVEEELHIVQSRPITTLYLIPGAGDRGNHVHVSVGHEQTLGTPRSERSLARRGAPKETRQPRPPSGSRTAAGLSIGIDIPNVNVHIEPEGHPSASAIDGDRWRSMAIDRQGPWGA